MARRKLWEIIGVSEEALIGMKAGASPREEYCSSRAPHEAHWWRTRSGAYARCAGRDWPQPEPPPYPADDEERIEP